MKFTLVIQSSPVNTEGSLTALRFAEALIANNQQIYRVFLTSDGVLNTSALTQMPQGENNLPELWHKFAKDNHIEIVACISAALKRGVINSAEANRYQKESSNMFDDTVLAGLGEYVDALKESDRVVCFGV
ncbi:MAG: sulfurtransferase complex subunit TusD [Pseudomonadales bacterium]|nr:sulfurtransferase complex subunit TusD [Pseudomonadales bacterium]